jgi:hypothetical protein
MEAINGYWRQIVFVKGFTLQAGIPNYVKKVYDLVANEHPA